MHKDFLEIKRHNGIEVSNDEDIAFDEDIVLGDDDDDDDGGASRVGR